MSNGKQSEVQTDLPIGGSNKDSNVEYNTIQALLAESEIEGEHPRTLCLVHSFRIRNCDPDGLAAKYFIDSIVTAGVLPDDNLKHIQEVRYRQTKVKSKEEEMTVIELWQLDEKTGE
jgi:hypothetical protein